MDDSEGHLVARLFLLMTAVQFFGRGVEGLLEAAWHKTLLWGVGLVVILAIFLWTLRGLRRLEADAQA